MEPENFPASRRVAEVHKCTIFLTEEQWNILCNVVTPIKSPWLYLLKKTSSYEEMQQAMQQMMEND